MGAYANGGIGSVKKLPMPGMMGPPNALMGELAKRQQARSADEGRGANGAGPGAQMRGGGEEDERPAPARAPARRPPPGAGRGGMMPPGGLMGELNAALARRSD